MKKIKGSKKAIFYTTAAIALTMVIIASYEIYGSYRLSARMDVIGTRIDTINAFIKDVSRDIENGVYIAGYRTLLGMEQYISTNGAFVDDSQTRFTESFVYGTINGQQISLMQDSTFTDWAGRISDKAQKLGIIFNLTVNKINLGQSEPWSVDIGLNLTIRVTDNLNTSSWTKDVYLKKSISIIGLEDPLYVVNSKGRVTNTITKSNITSFVINGNVKNLMVHANNSYYAARNGSSDFMMRLEGNMSNSTFGIESLSNLDKFRQQGLQTKERSVVDYIYFASQNTKNYRVNNTPEWFMIDEDHLDFYQVRNITI